MFVSHNKTKMLGFVYIIHFVREKSDFIRENNLRSQFCKNKFFYITKDLEPTCVKPFHLFVQCNQIQEHKPI